MPREEIEDPQDLVMGCFLNGETLQSSSTKEMIFSVAVIISYISRVITLAPEIDGLGALTNPVEREG